MLSRNALAGVGVVLLVLAVLQLAAPNSHGQMLPANSPNWPPHPSNVVNLHGTNFGGSIPPSQSITLFVVPPDRWFVMSEWNPGGHAGYLELVDSSGTMKIKGPEDFDMGGGPLGIVFSPGTDVVLRNINNNGPASLDQFHLTAYLAR